MAHAHSKPKGPIGQWASAVWQTWENLFSFAGSAKNIIATFAILMIGTVLTVGVYQMDRNLNLPPFFDDHVGPMDLVVGLMIATIKASFVLAFFMHLLHEQRLILRVMGLTVFLFIALLGLCILAFYSKPGDHFQTQSWPDPYAKHQSHHGDDHGAPGEAAHPETSADHAEEPAHTSPPATGEQSTSADDGHTTPEAAPPGHGSPDH